MSRKLPSTPILCFDLGGTKLAVGIVTVNGKVLESIRVRAEFEKGKTHVLNQMLHWGKKYLVRFPQIKKVGISSAGPLLAKKGLLLSPTNFRDQKGKLWGEVALKRWMQSKLHRPVWIENDAACAALAEYFVGVGKKKGVKDLMVLTLGTGLGTGIMVNGELVRAGRNLHPEAGHILLNSDDTLAPCGCGNNGCAEAYLSGKNFVTRLNRKNKTKTAANELYKKAKSGDQKTLQALQEYSVHLAQAIGVYAVLYAPKCVTLSGSFAQLGQFFLPKTRLKLKEILANRNTPTLNLVPKITLSSLKNDTCLIGASLITRQKKT